MDPSRVRVVGPLAAYRVGFGRELSGQGYTPGSASLQLLLMAHVSRWLVAQGLTAGDFTPVRVGEFLEARRVGGYTSRMSLRGLTPLLGYLRGLGAVPLPSEPVGARRSSCCWRPSATTCHASGGWPPAPCVATWRWRGCSWRSANDPTGSICSA